MSSVARRTAAATAATPSPSCGAAASSSTSRKSTQPQLNGQTTVQDVVAKNATNNSSGAIPFPDRGRAIAVLMMSLSLAIHLGGYELARAAVMALFTSDRLGFGKGKEGGLSALPMAVGVVSPFSVALLWFYAMTLGFGGPAYALRTNTLICAGTQMLAGWLLGTLDQFSNTGMARLASDTSIQSIRAMSQPVLFVLFIFQNAYVQLLYAQHWAFISSVVTPEEGTKLFAPIAGLGSIGSTLAAGSVSMLVEKAGLIGLLYMAGVAYVTSAFLADIAFGLARRHGFEPKGGKNGEASGNQSGVTPKNESKDDNSSSTSSSSTSASCFKKMGLFQQAHALFQRVPVLEALFNEVVISQCLSSLVNFIYLYKLKATITDDAVRAGWSGNFYAWINGVSGIFQFFVIPILLKHCEARRIWLFMPTLMLCCTFYQISTYHSSGLFGASVSFFAIKTMEYSLRGAANEMLYVSLDYESRYLGKKVISLIAGKFGKSAMAVALSLVMVVYGERPNMMWYLLTIAMLFTFLWFISSIRLHSLIETSIER